MIIILLFVIFSIAFARSGIIFHIIRDIYKKV